MFALSPLLFDISTNHEPSDHKALSNLNIYVLPYLADHHHTIVMGDLNFRCKCTVEEMMTKIEEKAAAADGNDMEGEEEEDYMTALRPEASLHHHKTNDIIPDPPSLYGANGHHPAAPRGLAPTPPPPPSLSILRKASRTSGYLVTHHDDDEPIPNLDNTPQLPSFLGRIASGYFGKSYDSRSSRRPAASGGNGIEMHQQQPPSDVGSGSTSTWWKFIELVDELRNAYEEKLIFFGFRETVINFAPT